jgi:hypothetical protein
MEWRDPLQQRAVEHVVLGVSTRRYARSPERLPEAITARGTSKSAVSERFVYDTERKSGNWWPRNRRAPIGSLTNDDVHFFKQAALAALGVDDRGNRHVLELREGATENAPAALLRRVGRTRSSNQVRRKSYRVRHILLNRSSNLAGRDAS